jgi:hypothetical protein
VAYNMARPAVDFIKYHTCQEKFHGLTNTRPKRVQSAPNGAMNAANVMKKK